MRKAKRYWLDGVVYTNSQALCRIMAKMNPGTYSVRIEEYESKPVPPKRRILFKCWWEQPAGAVMGDAEPIKYIVADRAYAAAREFAPDPVLITNKPGLGRVYRAGGGRRFIVAFFKTV